MIANSFSLLVVLACQTLAKPSSSLLLQQGNSAADDLLSFNRMVDSMASVTANVHVEGQPIKEVQSTTSNKHLHSVKQLKKPSLYQSLKADASKEPKEETIFSLDAFPSHKLRVNKQVESGGLCDANVKQISGYLDVDEEKHFYFWFFESRATPAVDPLLLWLNGGPGCSSLTGLLMELGPCRPTEGGEGTTPNAYSWNSNSNIIFLDQPVNVGFSYSDGAASPTNSDDAATDVLAFLQLFLQAYPQYGGKKEFTVSGESYAGHYIPAIGKAVLDSNELVAQRSLEGADDEGIVHVNMVSVAIGNGLTDPLTQYEFYPDMACDDKYGPILPEETCDEMRGKFPTCQSLISACYAYKSPFTCVPGSFYCNSAMIQPFQTTGLNIYDIRKECDPSNPLCYDILNDIEGYLNLPEIQEELGVDVAYEGCKRDINMNFLLAGDWMRPYVEYIPLLLDAGVRVLIYAGDADYICNWIGNKAWTMALEWSGSEEFNAAEDVLWTSNYTGREAGEFRMYENFAFLRVYEAGHMVPYDQPEHSLEFINLWINNGKPKKAAEGEVEEGKEVEDVEEPHHHPRPDHGHGHGGNRRPSPPSRHPSPPNRRPSPPHRDEPRHPRPHHPSPPSSPRHPRPDHPHHRTPHHEGGEKK